MAAMIENMKGAIGESVALLLARQSNRAHTLSLKRELITTTSINHETTEAIGYIRLSSFDQNAGENLQLSLATLNARRL